MQSALLQALVQLTRAFRGGEGSGGGRKTLDAVVLGLPHDGEDEAVGTVAHACLEGVREGLAGVGIEGIQCAFVRGYL
jgi:hypothetical protein